MLKKIVCLCCCCLFLSTAAASAALRSTKVGNVTTMESAYTYQLPVDKNGQPVAKLTDGDHQANIFSVYVKATRFYNKDFRHFRTLQELALTSNTKTIDLLFDDSMAPRLEYEDAAGHWQTLGLGKITYCDAYFISFKVNAQLLAPLQQAQALRIVFPYITNGPAETDNLEGIYLKKSLEKDSTVAYMTYALPKKLIQEWQTVLMSNLAPDKIVDTLQ